MTVEDVAPRVLQNLAADAVEIGCLGLPGLGEIGLDRLQHRFLLRLLLDLGRSLLLVEGADMLLVVDGILAARLMHLRLRVRSHDDHQEREESLDYLHSFTSSLAWESCWPTSFADAALLIHFSSPLPPTARAVLVNRPLIAS